MINVLVLSACITLRNFFIPKGKIPTPDHSPPSTLNLINMKQIYMKQQFHEKEIYEGITVADSTTNVCACTGIKGACFKLSSSEQTLRKREQKDVWI